MNTRPLYEIAREIRSDWQPHPYFGALPYIDAMRHLDSVTDLYGVESGACIVRYFLANANTWRGQTAREIKVELKEMIKGVY